MYNNYVKSLAQEYVDVVHSMGLGIWTSEEYAELSDQRSVIHEQLLDELGETRWTIPDMHLKALSILREV